MKVRILSAVCGIALALGGTSTGAADLRSIGISISDLGNPFFAHIARGAEAEARRLAGEEVGVRVASSAYDLQRQIRQIDGFILGGVDLILLSAADADGIEPAVHRAQQAGIPVLAVDVNATGADVTVTTDNTQAGELACQYMAERLDGRGRVVIINGPPVSSVIERVSGCRRVLADYAGIALLSDEHNGGGSQQGGLEKMTILLTAHTDIDAVFTINDPTAVGAELAARQAERDDFFIVSIDGAPSATGRLRDPDSLIEATAAQFPERMARNAVQVGYGMLNGDLPEQSKILIPARLITKDNVGEYEGWGG